MKPGFFDLAQQQVVLGMLATPASIRRHEFPVMYHQLVAGAVNTAMTLELIVEGERDMLKRL
jgi:hypothetical protein